MAATKTTTRTATKATDKPEISAEAAMAGALLEIQKMLKAQAEEIAALKSAQYVAKQATVVVEPSHASVGTNGTVKLVTNPTDPQLREFAVANDLLVNSRGAIAASHPIRDAYRAAYQSQNGKVTTRANGAKPNGTGTNWWDTKAPSAERQFTPRPSAREAADEYVRHPEHDAVESLDSDTLFVLARAGKETAHPSLRKAPIGGNHRRCIMLLGRGTDTPSVKLVVADALAIMRDAGIPLPC